MLTSWAKVRAFTMAFIMASTACGDRELTGLAMTDGTMLHADLSEVSDFQAVDRFTVSLRTDGSYRPGSPIQIVVDVVANLRTSDAELRVTLPEVEAAKMSGWDETFAYPVNQPIPAAVARRRPLDRGVGFREQLVVSIPAPGYYRVVATVAHRGEPDLVQAGRWIRNTVVAEVWLLVAESEGRATTSFDTTRVPTGKLRQPGPFRTKPSRRSNDHDEQSGFGERMRGPSAQSAAYSTLEFITYRALYYNIDSSSYEPVSSALAVIRCCEKLETQFICDEESTWHEDSYTTDAQGYFLFVCAGDEYEGEVTTYAGAALFVVRGGVGPAFGDVDQDCGSSFDTVIPSKPARVFYNMRLALTGS